MRRTIVVPLAIYLGVAVGLPLLNGAAARPDFAGHAANTLLVSGAIALAWTLVLRRVLQIRFADWRTLTRVTVTRSWRSRRAPARTDTCRS